MNFQVYANANKTAVVHHSYFLCLNGWKYTDKVKLFYSKSIQAQLVYVDFLILSKYNWMHKL